MRLSLATIMTLLAFSSAAPAFETDQFMTWTLTLNDSKDALNAFLQSEYQKVLDQSINPEAAGSSEKYSHCEDVAVKMIELESGTEWFSTTERWGMFFGDIERYPDSSRLSSKEVIGKTIYTDFSLVRRLFRISPTINVNGVYFGTDKLSHFLDVGLDYYKTYLRALGTGKNAREAASEAIIRGIATEVSYYGLFASGIVSYADLEANWTGFEFIRTFCEGANPVLRREGARWVLARPLDVTAYVTPFFDESYNENYTFKGLWNLFIKDKVMKYCVVRNNPTVVARFAYYDSIAKDNPSLSIIRAEMAVGMLEWFDPAEESLDTICPRGGSLNAPLASRMRTSAH